MPSRSQRQRARKAAAAQGENRGGARQGTPGTAYANRSDLNATGRAPTPPTVAPHQTYGVATQQQQSLQTVPMGNAPAPNLAAQPDPRAAAAARIGAQAQSLPGLMDPTARPGEPVTAGAALGPGPGPESMGLPNPTAGQDDQAEGFLRAIYNAHPNSDLARLIAQYDARRR